MDDVDVLDPARREVALTGRASVQLRPITAGQLPRFLRAVRPILLAVTAKGDALKEANAEIQLMDLYIDHGENINAAVAIASGLPLEEVEALPLDDLMRLAVAVWEINQDFFGQRVIPLLGPLTNLNGAGPTPPRS